MNLSDCILVTLHGFNDWGQGEDTTDKAIPYGVSAGFREEDCYQFDYGWFWFLSVRFRTKQKAKELAELIKSTGKPAVIVAYSHGNIIANIAATEEGAHVIYHIGIHPAMNINTFFDDDVLQVDIYHNKTDNVVKWAKRLRKYSPLSLFNKSLWGEAGRIGIKTGQGSVKNINDGTEPGMPKPKNHGGFWRYRNLSKWMPFAFNRVIKLFDNLSS